MSDTVHGHPHSSRTAPARALVELLSSMRFAISLLTVICIASVIGTVLKQHEPAANYVNQFGPFWSELFLALRLNAVYSAWWFLLILAFLVTSTSLCIARNAPRYLADLRSYKENVREQSLKAFHHRAHAVLGAEAPEAAARRIGGCWPAAAGRSACSSVTPPPGRERGGWWPPRRGPPTRSAISPRTAPSCSSAWGACWTAT